MSDKQKFIVIIERNEDTVPYTAEEFEYELADRVGETRVDCFEVLDFQKPEVDNLVERLEEIYTDLTTNLGFDDVAPRELWKVIRDFHQLFDLGESEVEGA
ncbi:unnamed protein product [marine sediment metagenome]|uniref:Uncharacterized protein n=1 Tax=marine sediment metagenome TaxID=412755 RepID=X1D539_9ZZZZ